MDVSDLLRRLVRRWVAVVIVVVLAIAAVGIGWSRAGSMRQTVAAVVIVPPRLGDEVYQQNPLLNLDNNLAQLATVLAQAMQSSTVADALQKAGATASFDVSTVTGTNPSFSQLSPQLEFTVTGDTDVQTVFTASTLVSQARLQLDALQNRAEVPSSARATLVESVVPTNAQVVGGSRLRSAGSLGLGVIVLGLVAILVVDAYLGRRSAPGWWRRLRASIASSPVYGSDESDGSNGTSGVALPASTNAAPANGAPSNGAKANGAKANGAKTSGAKTNGAKTNGADATSRTRPS